MMFSSSFPSLMVGAHTHVNTLKIEQLRIRAGEILILQFSHLLKHIYEKMWVAIHIQLIILVHKTLTNISPITDFLLVICLFCLINVLHQPRLKSANNILEKLIKKYIRSRSQGRNFLKVRYVFLPSVIRLFKYIFRNILDLFSIFKVRLSCFLTLYAATYTTITVFLWSVPKSANDSFRQIISGPKINFFIWKSYFDSYFRKPCYKYYTQ